MSVDNLMGKKDLMREKVRLAVGKFAAGIL